MDQPDTKTIIPNKVMQVLIAGRVGDKVLTPSAIRVYLALFSRARLRKREATEGELAAITGLDRRSVRRSLMELWEVGLIEVGPVGYWAPLNPSLQGDPAPVQGLQGEVHRMQQDVHPMHNPPAKNAVHNGAKERPEIKEEAKGKKHPLHRPTHQRVADEAVALPVNPYLAERTPLLREAPLGEASKALPRGQTRSSVLAVGQELEVLSTLPGAQAGVNADMAFEALEGDAEEAGSREEVSPDHVNGGTKYLLQEALKRANLWRDFYRVFRPSFAQEFLWVRYLRRLEEQALPLGEAFLHAIARTLEGAARGVVRYPTAYLGALLREVDVGQPSGHGASSRQTAEWEGVELESGTELLLPDGRRGYFAGWTQGGRKGFVEVDGVALVVDRETLLGFRVLG
ncbi:helix-turn-helix domain-containing protein [Thermus sp. NEB1569]|uniref:helix-turn-helix domain-containing protein n=1 Tax=Thermus sp. NEB1569 TaxID=2918899 RepID=UPI001EFADBF8|nr:helix-turn-helix domain-containing protein [Thermus sp. NEB1569]ULR39717.1 helix-turn-helix domain-containing protein [Thermus sp. NEB1569]